MLRVFEASGFRNRLTAIRIAVPGNRRSDRLRKKIHLNLIGCLSPKNIVKLIRVFSLLSFNITQKALRPDFARLTR